MLHLRFEEEVINNLLSMCSLLLQKSDVMAMGERRHVTVLSRLEITSDRGHPLQAPSPVQ